MVKDLTSILCRFFVRKPFAKLLRNGTQHFASIASHLCTKTAFCANLVVPHVHKSFLRNCVCAIAFAQFRFFTIPL